VTASPAVFLSETKERVDFSLPSGPTGKRFVRLRLELP
jgi:hypothetical protein